MTLGHVHPIDRLAGHDAGDKIAMSGLETFRLYPLPDPDLRGHLKAIAERIGFPTEAMARG
ncbi:hypothetical protein [Tardiphaga sp.]|uniref:hypothetical protein n=1 Tax=Tardiphaga sp. TaxID=1926292 RepID=UPI00260CE5C9|nr:hypothetical protein [Tardiphaga sp.]MDB5619651.1 hypothetical protein [Tardiphaga sp.]